MEFRYGDPVHDPARAPKKAVGIEFHPLCLTCGYDLRGLRSERCPECGNVFVHREWDRAVRDAKSSIVQVEDLLAWVPWAWKVVVFGIALFLTGLIPGAPPAWRGFVRVAGLLCGLLGFFFALNVLRVRRVPLWARQHLAKQPDYSSALVGVLGGLALATGALLLP